MIKSCKDAYTAIGHANYDLKESEISNLIYRRSLYAVSDIIKGAKFTTENVRSIRPGYGLEPKHYNRVLDKYALTKIERGTPLSWR